MDRDQNRGNGEKANRKINIKLEKRLEWQLKKEKRKMWKRDNGWRRW